MEANQFKKHLEVIYKPSEWQKKFHSVCNPDGSMICEVLGAGAAGPGKSYALAMNAMDKVSIEFDRATNPEHPFPIRMGESQGWALHLRRDSTMLMQTLSRVGKLYPKIDPGVRWSAKDMTYHFTCGYKVQFGHCKDVDDWEKYQSNQYDEIDFDELTQFEEIQFHQIRSRLRSSDPILSKMLRIRSMSNPMMRTEDGAKIVVRNPFWVRDRYVKPAINGNVILKRQEFDSYGNPFIHTRLYLPARLRDNPDKAYVAQYDRQLSTLPAHLRDALRDGNWFVIAGAYWSDVWDQNLHVCRPFKVPQGWKMFRSMDWGYKAYGCIGWYAVDEDGNLYKVWELTFIREKPSVVADRVKHIEIGLGVWDKRRDCSRITGPADTQLWEERGDEIAVSKADVFAACGVNWVKVSKGPGSRARNAMLLHERLGDHDNYTTQPGIVFFERCENTIVRIPSVPVDPKDPEAPLDTKQDHWIDETLYACEYASDANRIPRVRRAKEAEEDEYDREPKNRSKGGPYGYGQVL